MATNVAGPPDNIFDLLFQEIENDRVVQDEKNIVTSDEQSPPEISNQDDIVSTFENNNKKKKNGIDPIKVQPKTMDTEQISRDKSLTESDIHLGIPPPLDSTKQSWIEPIETTRVEQSPSLIDLDQRSDDNDDDDSTEIVTLYEDPSSSKINKDLTKGKIKISQRQPMNQSSFIDLSPMNGIHSADIFSHIEEPPQLKTDPQTISNTNSTSMNAITSQQKNNSSKKSDNPIFNAPSISIEPPPIVENNLFTFLDNDKNNQMNNDEQLWVNGPNTDTLGKTNISVYPSSTGVVDQEPHHNAMNFNSTLADSKVEDNFEEPSRLKTDPQTISNTNSTSMNGITSQQKNNSSKKSDNPIFNAPSISIEPPPVVENNLFTFLDNDENNQMNNNEQIWVHGPNTDSLGRINVGANPSSTGVIGQEHHHNAMNFNSTLVDSKVEDNFADDFLQISLSGDVTKIIIDQPVPNQQQNNILDTQQNLEYKEDPNNMKENILVDTKNQINDSILNISHNIDVTKGESDSFLQQSNADKISNIKESKEQPNKEIPGYPLPIQGHEYVLNTLDNSTTIMHDSSVIDDNFHDHASESVVNNVKESSSSVPTWSHFGQNSSSNNYLPKTQTYSSQGSLKNGYVEIDIKHDTYEGDESKMNSRNNISKKTAKRKSRNRLLLLTCFMLSVSTVSVWGYFYILPRFMSSPSPPTYTDIPSTMPTQRPSLIITATTPSSPPTRLGRKNRPYTESTSAPPTSTPGATNQTKKPEMPSLSPTKISSTKWTTVPSIIPSLIVNVSNSGSPVPSRHPSSQSVLSRTFSPSYQPTPYFHLNYDSRSPSRILISTQPTDTHQIAASNHPSINLDTYHGSLNPSGYPSTKPTMTPSSLRSNQPSVTLSSTHQNKTLYTLIGETFGFPNDHEGFSISLSENGKRLIVGACQRNYGDDNNLRMGMVRIYEYVSESENNNSFWVLIGEMGGDFFCSNYGYSVTISGDGSTIAYGNIRNDTSDAGKVLVYKYEESDSWTNIGNILGEFNGDSFGSSLSLSFSGQYLAVGAPTYNSSAGRAYLYNNSDESQWTVVGNKIITGSANDFLGWSVSLSQNGTQFIIGAPQNEGIDKPGFVVVYKINETLQELSEVGFFTSDDVSSNSDRFGFSIAQSSDGRRVLIGSPYFNGKGLAQLYEKENDSGAWSLISEVQGSKSGDLVGFSVDISSNGNVISVSKGDKVQILNTKPIGQNAVITIEFNLTQRFDRSISIAGNGTILAVGASSSDSSKIFQLSWPEHIYLL